MKSILFLALASLAVSRPDDDNPSSSSVTDDEMGPAAFMWPSDRVWAGDMDNQAPCGSRASPGNRTEFPLSGGSVALVAQDDYYNAKISIAYSNDPTSNDDFSTLIEEKSISDLNPGHTCVDVPDAPSRISAGDNATIQIIYRADWDAPHNQTFYACADIKFIEAADFSFRIPCFNATEPGEDDKEAGATANPSATATHKATSSGSSESSESSEGSSSGGSNKLGGGAIAGIVVGAIAGVALIAVGAFFIFRRRQQKKRTERIARMENSAHRHEFATNKNSTSQNSVQLKDMP
ncbi:hypothetical protein QQX98_000696 [Neonectria punicea]|uniref:Copper acquisition factor BIM1-like domain-containing protein n=1 Tax=Neonectria punicea TaxID=979145 RepID=A0ABR1HSS4_9HYPO